MARADPKVLVRLPVDLKEYVRDSAQANHRSINGEIVHALRERQKSASAPSA